LSLGETMPHSALMAGALWKVLREGKDWPGDQFYPCDSSLKPPPLFAPELLGPMGLGSQ
jgi:hypothetical protein